jgi:5-aminolevulinate synthase
MSANFGSTWWRHSILFGISQWATEGGFLGVGVEGGEPEAPLWTDAQLEVDNVLKELKAGQGATGVLEAVLENERKATAQAVVAAA